jgi:hypothetical protein
MVVNLRCSRSAHRPAEASKKRARGRADGAGRLGSFHLARLTPFAVRDTMVLSIGRFPHSLSSPLPVRRAPPAGMQGAGPVDPTARPEPLRPSVSSWGSAGHGHPPRQLGSGRHAAFRGARGRSHHSGMRVQPRSTSRGVRVARLQNLPHRIGRRCVHQRDHAANTLSIIDRHARWRSWGAATPTVAHATVRGRPPPDFARGRCSVPCRHNFQ